MNKKSAYFLSHNGLGDNIISIGAVRFLLQYYETVYLLCKDHYKENLDLLVPKRVYTVPFDSKNEFEHCNYILSNVEKEKYDIFTCGCHNRNIPPHITITDVFDYQKTEYDLNAKDGLSIVFAKSTEEPVIYEARQSLHFPFIQGFYEDIGLDLSVYFEYFDIDSCEKSREYYNMIRDYRIVFLHTQGSNRSIDMSDVIEKYKHQDHYIMICSNMNVYNSGHPKYDIANKFVNIKIAYYIDIIKHAEIIHVINSCFFAIVYPLYISKKIQPVECKIYEPYCP